MNEYCIYLRKSRADADAEARGEGETLSRHMAMLAELAEKQGLNIVKVYREIVSGDSIAARPQMQALLADVAEGRYTGVLVAEIERLVRGDTIDQGIVAQAFRESSTKIVTPSKTYDPQNEFDEEYFEFSLFMSRREYKTIKRRMQAGRLASVKEGNYIGSASPYGYRKVTPEPKVHTLEIVPEEAETVRLIYNLYLEGHGAKYIADELNRMGISPQKSRYWESCSVKKILANPVYCGKVSWKTKANGDTYYRGIHEPIISEKAFLSVMDKKKLSPAPQLHSSYKLKNYYHGILFCKNCGHQLKRRCIAGSGREYLLCTYGECKGYVVSSSAERIDEVVIAALRYRIKRLGKLEWKGSEAEKEHIPDKRAMLNSELEKSKKQLNRMYDLLEQGVYDAVVFRERSEYAAEKIKRLEEALSEYDRKDDVPFFLEENLSESLRNIIDAFSCALTDEKNRLLKAAFRRICYFRAESSGNEIILDAEFL